MRIGLVADVPDQLVAGRVEHIVERHGQLDHAEPGAEVPAGRPNRGDRLGAQLVGQLAQLRGWQPAQVGREVSPYRAAASAGWQSSGALHSWPRRCRLKAPEYSHVPLEQPQVCPDVTPCQCNPGQLHPHRRPARRKPFYAGALACRCIGEDDFAVTFGLGGGALMRLTDLPGHQRARTHRARLARCPTSPRGRRTSAARA